MLLLTGISFAIQICPAFFRGGFWRIRERLERTAPLKSDISITAVIPARDEAELVGRTVRSRWAQKLRGALTPTIRARTPQQSPRETRALTS